MAKQQLPSDALTKRATPIRRVAIAAASVVVVAGLAVGGVALGQTLGPGLNHPTATAVALPADGPAPLSDAELAAMQQTADAWQAQIVADAAAKAAADAAAAQAAAAQAAADAAKKAAAQKAVASGPIKCPVGSSANSNDGVNDTSCFPTVCFGITVPDPAHPECNVAFKP